MAAQTVFPVGLVMFTPLMGGSMDGEEQGVAEIPQSELAAPQLVMLANIALTSEDGRGGPSSDFPAEEKQMVELKTVGSSSFSDSEDEDMMDCYGDPVNNDAADSRHADSSPGVYPETPQVVSCRSYKGLEEEEDEEEEEEVEEQELEGEAQTEDAPASPKKMALKRKRSQQPSVENSKNKKKPFHCKPCQYEAECEEEFVHHIQVHGAKKLMVEEQVEEEEEESSKRRDLSTEEGEEGAVGTKGVIRCERCGYNTYRYDHYLAHLKHHSKEGDSQRVYKCTICSYTTISQYHWKKHLRNHFPSKLYTCGECCYFSDRKNNYVQHLRTHTGERPFQCPYCKYSSSQKTHLTRHMRTHSGERPFRCYSCSYLAANQHEVTRHTRQVHNGPKPLSCPHCQYKTADRSNYKKHVALHVNRRQFPCPVCCYAASKKCNLQYHVKSRHPDCTDITLDVSKVKLRIKKPESSASRDFGEDKETQYILTGIKAGNVQRRNGRKEGVKGGEGEGGGGGDKVGADKQFTPGPINLSSIKTSKTIPLLTASKTEQRDKAPKRRAERDILERTKQKEVPKREAMRKAQKSAVAEGRRGQKPVERKEKGVEKPAEQIMESEQTKVVEKRTDRDTHRKGKAAKVPKVTVETQPRRERRTRKMTHVEPDKEDRKQTGVEAEKTEEEREAKERAERERVEKERAERERMEKEREEKERTEKERLERERIEKERVKRERAEREVAEKERLEKERAERERKERMEKERLERERAERERLEEERMEKERETRKRLEEERMEKERETRKRLEEERMEKEREARERLEQEKMEKERVEKERAERERIEKERLEKERLDRERKQKERMEKERVERERAEKEQLERERMEKERLERERAEHGRVEKERAERGREEVRMEKVRKSQDAVMPVKRGRGRPPKATRAAEKASRGQGQNTSEEVQGKEATAGSRKRKAAASQPPPNQAEASCGPTRKLSPQEGRPQRSIVLRGRSDIQASDQVPECGDKPSKMIKQSPRVGDTKRTKNTEAKLNPVATKSGSIEAVSGTAKIKLDTQNGGTERGGQVKEYRGSILGKEHQSAKDSPGREVEEAGVQKTAGGERNGEQETPRASGSIHGGRAPGWSPQVSNGTEPAPRHVSVTRQGKATDAEDDEGIHSHDGSEVSDNVSEGSDDSGLHGAIENPTGPGASAAGTTTTPMTTPGTTPVTTPTEGPPTVTAAIKPQTHTCVFCDRTFKVEVEYRLHLNRHLVNVYYLEDTAAGDH